MDMYKTSTLKITLTLCFALTVGILRGQTAEDIIQKYVSKIGGMEKWKATQTMVSTGTSSLMGQELPYTISSKAPNLLRLEVKAMGQTLVQAFDGKNAWTINPFQGLGKPEIMSPEVGRAFSGQNQLRPVLLDIVGNGLKINLMSKELINNIACDKVEIVHKEGDKEYYFFDPNTSLLIMIRKTGISGQAVGKITESFLSEYKEEQGILMPHIVQTKIDGNLFSKNTIISVKINTPLENEIFQFPVSK